MQLFYSTVSEIASEGLKFRVFEVSLADLQSDQDAERSFRKFRLIAEDVQGRNVLTNFHGMDLTTDKLRSMVKKWQTLIEANVDVKTTDGYLLRVFCIGFTNKDQLSTRKTCYAQHAQVCIRLTLPLIHAQFQCSFQLFP
jgi:small subunit ribosomal protein S3Ae